MKHLVITLLILMLVTPFIQAATDPEDSLILYMSFDTVDGQSIIDHSKYGNDGEMMGDPEHVAGKFGKAVGFNGQNQWVQVPHHETLTVDEDFTVMAWINIERHFGPGNANWQGIVAKGNNPRSYSLYIHGPTQCMHLSAGGGSTCNQQILLNEWQHVVGQMESGTHRYWLNGKNIGESPGKQDPPGLADTSNVMIGRTHENSRELLGVIDEVRIWNRALSEDEIVEQMNKGFDESFPVDPQHKVATTWGTIKSQRH